MATIDGLTIRIPDKHLIQKNGVRLNREYVKGGDLVKSLDVSLRLFHVLHIAFF
ncbi:hypothetical protein BVRB_2g025230 [Beta vulgaris subsp. vulgaris]|nr:hypothetical protein BVRB_2g025230 [Beta vulgaris subsp. vulgaris]